MRVAISTTGESLEDTVDERFGRAAMFLIVDTETMETRTVKNGQNLALQQGAGIQAAQNVLAEKPDVILTGNCGPKAFRALQAGGAEVVVGVGGKVRDAVQAYMDGKYKAAAAPNVNGHW